VGVEREWALDQIYLQRWRVIFWFQLVTRYFGSCTILYHITGLLILVILLCILGGCGEKIFATIAVTEAKAYLDISSATTGKCYRGRSGDNGILCSIRKRTKSVSRIRSTLVSTNCVRPFILLHSNSNIPAPPL